MTMQTDSIQATRALVSEFLTERGWGPYNSPKNLSMCLASEVGEVLDHFRWLSEEQSYHLDSQTLSEVQDEIGDVMISLIALSDKLGIDPIHAVKEKLKKLALKYPKKPVNP